MRFVGTLGDVRMALVGGGSIPLAAFCYLRALHRTRCRSCPIRREMEAAYRLPVVERPAGDAEGV